MLCRVDKMPHMGYYKITQTEHWKSNLVLRFARKGIKICPFCILFTMEISIQPTVRMHRTALLRIFAIC